MGFEDLRALANFVPHILAVSVAAGLTAADARRRWKVVQELVEWKAATLKKQAENHDKYVTVESNQVTITNVHSKLDAKFDGMHDKIETRVDGLREEFHKLDTEQKVQKSRLDTLEREVIRTRDRASRSYEPIKRRHDAEEESGR